MNIFDKILKELPKSNIEVVPNDPKDQEIANQMSQILTHVKHTTFEEMADTLLEGIIQAYKECPDSENKTFEEVADWAGKHVLLTERTDNNG